MKCSNTIINVAWIKFVIDDISEDNEQINVEPEEDEEKEGKEEG